MAAPGFRRLCSVYAKPDALWIVCAHQAPSWIWKAGLPVQKLPREAAPDLIGTTVLAILDRSTQGRAEDRRQIDYTVPNATGFRSWRAAERNATSLSVEFDGNVVTVSPRKRAEKGVFVEQSDKISCGPRPGEIGSSVLEALKHCS